MSILLPPNPTARHASLPEPLWLPAPESPSLPVDELHIWRVRIGEPRWGVSTDGAGEMAASLFRNDVMARYTGGALPGLPHFPGAGLRIAMAQCDHLALIAVSRGVREVGLDVERVRDDIPFEEMADGFLDVRAQWDLRTTWSAQEKAWKFFQFWTSNEACAQARPKSCSSQCCEVRGFSPEQDFIAALAIEGGPEAALSYWDWQP
ncbi:MAG TPA: hypothetical protein VHY22_09655 [Chthoniobacteraceae bacterium]|jgi:hypothetical protein|nr:hypothetical protein [Chthoniobacteraceae bacterium]